MINLTKKQYSVILILTFTILCSGNLFGQSYSKEFKSGETAFISGNYSEAADHYEKASLAATKLGKKHLELFYKLGFCQMQMKEYKKASNSFGKYQSIAKRNKADLKELKQVTEWKDWCVSELSDYGAISGTVDKTITITNIAELNSPLDDYGAFMTYDNTIIMFSSNRKTERDKDLIDINDDVYFAEYKDGTFSEPKSIATLSEKLEEASSTITSDDLTIYLTVSKDFNETANIYKCSKIAGAWGELVKLEGDINSKYWDGNPSVSQDGKTLYFVSNRPGSKGKDIYFSVKQDDGSWGEPKNIGYPINTKFDEITPHIDASGKKLYFSSKGHISYGGFDIYYSEFEASNLWGDPINLGLPINSDRDDIFFVTTSDPNIYLFSSKRPGGIGIYDIYKGEKGVAPTKEQVPTIIPDDEQPITIEIDQDKKNELDKLNNSKETPTNLPDKEKETITKNETVNKEITKPTKETEKPIKETYTTQKETKNYQETASSKTNYTGNIFTSSVEGLYFKVQIGAYQKHITKYHKVFADKLNPEKINEEYYPPLYKYTTGQYPTIRTATSYKMELRNMGFSDAFLTCYFNERRISMDEAKDMIKQKSKVN